MSVRRGCVLVDVLSALTFMWMLAIPLSLVVVVRHGGRGSALVLAVALLCAVAVRRGRAVLGVVGLVHVAVVRVRAVDRDRHVDVGLLRAGFARGRLGGAVFVVRGLALVDLLAAVPTSAV